MSARWAGPLRSTRAEVCVEALGGPVPEQGEEPERRFVDALVAGADTRVWSPAPDTRYFRISSPAVRLPRGAWPPTGWSRQWDQVRRLSFALAGGRRHRKRVTSAWTLDLLGPAGHGQRRALSPGGQRPPTRPCLAAAPSRGTGPAPAGTSKNDGPQSVRPPVRILCGEQAHVNRLHRPAPLPGVGRPTTSHPRQVLTIRVRMKTRRAARRAGRKGRRADESCAAQAGNAASRRVRRLSSRSPTLAPPITRGLQKYRRRVSACGLGRGNQPPDNLTRGYSSVRTPGAVDAQQWAQTLPHDGGEWPIRRRP